MFFPFRNYKTINVSTSTITKNLIHTADGTSLIMFEPSSVHVDTSNKCMIFAEGTASVLGVAEKLSLTIFWHEGLAITTNVTLGGMDATGFGDSFTSDTGTSQLAGNFINKSVIVQSGTRIYSYITQGLPRNLQGTLHIFELPDNP
ncbi:MAG: hypothetical protein ACI9IA_000217 [Enterobacterales bacterium]|jgi:hypothetical protein